MTDKPAEGAATEGRAARKRRVFVALDPCEADLADFEASARLAAGLNAELVALFVEDSSLIAAADLPVTHLVAAGRRGSASVDAAAMRRAFRVAAQRSREAMSAAAARWRLEWSFEVTQTGPAREAMSRLTADDLLALCGMGRAGRPRGAAGLERGAPCPVVKLRRGATRAQPVAVLYEGDESLLRLGRDLARIYECPLRVLVFAAEEAVLRAREAEAIAWLGGAGVAARIDLVPSAEAGEAIARLRDAYPGFVLIDRQGVLGRQIDMEALAEQARTSVVVVGGAG
jgi:hypothetical protein